MTIEERWVALQGRPAGFDYLRILLASAVLLWHSYQYSYGQDAMLAAYTAGWGYLVVLILPIFFALSGFLVSTSIDRSPSIAAFLGLRAIRIFPGLVVEVTLSAVLLGPLVSGLTLKEYSSSPEFFRYFLNCLGWIHYTLPGVFHDNIYPNLVNASLWTVPFELECYVLISGLAFIGVFKRRNLLLPIFIAVSVAVAVNLLAKGHHPLYHSVLNGRMLVLNFFAGIVFSRLRSSIPYNVPAGIFALIAASGMLLTGDILPYFSPLFIGYGTVCLGLTNPRRTLIVTSGDYSYGVYLYAGPIQQTIVYVLGRQSTWIVNVAIALPLAVALALFSWWCVEKPFLKLRRFITRRPAPTPAREGTE